MLKIAILLKQVPRVGDLALGGDGRLIRDAQSTEINPYCKRALAKGLELANEYGGYSVAFTLGPENAKDVLLEALFAGVSKAVHICDPSFAGSDTLATAQILAKSIQLIDEFDLVLMGRASIDSDTGQVGPQLSEQLDLPFLFSARKLSLRGSRIFATLEDDFGYRDVSCDLPVVISCAERLCDPTKIDVAKWRNQSAEKIITHSAIDLGVADSLGTYQSMTQVIKTTQHATARTRTRLTGTPEEIAQKLTSILLSRGALNSLTNATTEMSTPTKSNPIAHNYDKNHAKPSPNNSSRVTTLLSDDVTANFASLTVVEIVVLIDPTDFVHGNEIIQVSEKIAAQLGCDIVGVVFGEATKEQLQEMRVDKVICVRNELREDQASKVLSELLQDRDIRALIAHSTPSSREILARFAAKNNLGMIGDAIDILVENEQIVGLKPAFGGTTVAHIVALSKTTIITLRLLETLSTHSMRTPKSISYFDPEPNSIVELHSRQSQDSIGALDKAKIILGIGAGIDPSEYGLLDPLVSLLNATTGATRRVTDRGQIPRSRQIGITGVFVAADLYLALGISGKINHMVGVSRSKTIVAINPDPRAPIFEVCDIAIVADYRTVIKEITTALEHEISALEQQFLDQSNAPK